MVSIERNTSTYIVVSYIVPIQNNLIYYFMSRNDENYIHSGIVYKINVQNENYS